MYGLQNWATKELERRQIRTIDEAITQSKALTDFRHENLDRTRKEEKKGGQDYGGREIVAKLRSSVHIPRSMIPISLMSLQCGVKDGTYKEEGCYICSGLHGCVRCPKLKSLGAILRELKEKDA